MDETIRKASIPQTVQELDQAVETYHTSDLEGEELYAQWAAIRQAALQQSKGDTDPDPVPGIDSY